MFGSDYDVFMMSDLRASFIVSLDEVI